MLTKLYDRVYRNYYGLNGKSVRNKVNLEWWASEPNLGDAISPVVVDWMLNKKGINRGNYISKTRHFMAIGSIFGTKRFDAVVWGSGVLSLDRVMVVNKQSKYRKYDLRAVRGPLTQQVLKFAGYKCPDIFGDPGILMPLIYNPGYGKKKYKYSVIMHHKLSDDMNSDIAHNMINIKTTDYKAFLNDLLASDIVISSSLHGIILAEAYGVPAIFLGSGMENQFIKFYDWYYSTGRYSVNIARTIEEALFMEPMRLPVLDGMRERLMEVFPYDLWE